MLTLLLCLVVAGVVRGSVYKTRFEGVTWDDDNWRLTTTVLDPGHYQSRMTLANGYLGINLAAVGPFFEVDTPVAGDNINGWPIFQRRQTFATVSGFWDYQAHTNSTNFPWLDQYGGESIISGVPHWSGLTVEANGHVLDASVKSSEISGYSSTLDIGAGTMTWGYAWTPEDEPAIDIEYSMFVHKLYVNRAAVQLKMTPSRDMNVTVMDVFDGDCAVRSHATGKGFADEGATMWSAVQPHGIDYVTAYIYSTMTGDDSVDLSTLEQVMHDSSIGQNKSSIAQSVKASLIAGKTSIIEKYIGGASTDAFPDPKAVAMKASADGAKAGFINELHSHIEEWGSIMTDDTVDDFSMPSGNLPDDDNILELQITAVVNPFNLLQNTVGPNAIKAAGNNEKLNTESISVGGLGSDSYGGMVFWDADVWMQPGLVVAFPEHAAAITNFRIQKHPQAKENVKMAYSSSKNQTGRYSKGGAVYPWTSGRFGNCTGTGPCFDYEYHLNGDIGLGMTNYLITTGDSDTFKEKMLPVYDDIAMFFSQTLGYNKTTGEYFLTNATDPDEYANHVDNPGFTMALIKSHLATANELRSRFDLPVNKHWAEQSRNVAVPIDEDANIILEYNTMNGSISVKQADIVLIDDFLDSYDQYSLSNLDYYAGQQSLSGPGMTYGVFSIVANDVSPSGCSSYTYNLYSSNPYIRAPWFQYSEQLTDNYEDNGGTHPAYPFLTGMGGSNRVAVYGYLGLRLAMDAFSVDPSLPPQIQHLNYRTIYWQGHAINATSNQTHTTLQRMHSSLPNANPSYSHRPVPVAVGNSRKTYSLSFSSPVAIENRRIGEIKTWKGNLAQCQSVSSPDPYQPGQFPLAAVDGAISTSWQPATKASHTAVLTVSLPGPPFAPVTAFRFDWAQNPPESFSVLFHNRSEHIPPSSHFPLSHRELLEAGIVNVTSQAHVEVSNPYKPREQDLIKPYIGNSTNVTLDRPVWSARFATLAITGNQGEVVDGASAAATVAEWGILMEDGTYLL